MERDDLNVVIVNFRTPDLTTRCVQSLLDLRLVARENVTVVDNASPDDSYTRLRTELPEGVRLVRASLNRGFGAGVNIGAMTGMKQNILVLNPDTYFVDDSLFKALRTLDRRPDVGLIGLDLTYPSGERQYSARRFYSMLDIVGRRTPLGKLSALRGRISRHLMKDAWIPGVPFDADWVMGTGFVVRRELYETLGGMDESYFLYMEDVDLCARVWAAGYRVACVPGAQLVHEHQRASNATPFSRAARHHLSSLLKFRTKFRVPLALPPAIEEIER